MIESASADGTKRDERASALPPPLVMQRDENADGHGDHGIDQPVIDAATDVVALQALDLLFGDSHAPRLRSAHEHVHLGLEPRQFFQHIALEVIIGDAHHEWVLGGFEQSVVGSVGHKKPATSF